MSEDRTIEQGKFSELVASTIVKKRKETQEGYVYRKYAGRMRKRTELGHPLVSGMHNAQELGPGGHSLRVRSTTDDFDLSMQQQYQISAEALAPMPAIVYDDNNSAQEGEPGRPAVERFGLAPLVSSPDLNAQPGPGSFIYGTADNKPTFPMYQY